MNIKKNEIQNKILSENHFSFLQENRQQPLIWTNGCFDIVHTGHIQYLYECKKLGGELIVGVNTDESVSRLKGPQRPILPLEERLQHLAAFFFVDYVLPFEEDTPLRWIQTLKPEFLVKGGDYRLTDIVGYDEVIAYGGRVLTIPLVEGKSTSAFIDKILKQYDQG